VTIHEPDQRTHTLELGSGFRRNLETRDPVAFRHGLVTHPDLSLDAVARLADSLDAESITREQAERPLVFADGAPEPGRVDDAGAVIRALDENSSWMTLLNVEQRPRYRTLIDEQLDALAARCGLKPSALRRRMGFVFASSPSSVTGAHFDVEHSLLLQLRGNRVLSFGEFADEQTRDREIRRYWNGSYGKLTTMPVHGTDVTIGPGDGVYIPPFRPHWLHNGSTSSLSLTITFYTRDNENETLVQACNERLRKLGLAPRRVGESVARDRVKVAVMRGYGAVRRLRGS
jgi:Cupin superfamily protein